MGVVVVGVDRSEISTKALRAAIREAEWRGASVVVVHVVPRPALETVAALKNSFDVEGFGADAIAEYLQEVEATFDGGFPVDVTSEVRVGHPGDEILKLAGSCDAELIVLGSRGRGGVKGLLLGSVTTYAVHHIRRPLLVVPGDEAEQDNE